MNWIKGMGNSKSFCLGVLLIGFWLISYACIGKSNQGSGASQEQVIVFNSKSIQDSVNGTVSDSAHTKIEIKEDSPRFQEMDSAISSQRMEFQEVDPNFVQRNSRNGFWKYAAILSFIISIGLIVFLVWSNKQNAKEIYGSQSCSNEFEKNKEKGSTESPPAPQSSGFEKPVGPVESLEDSVSMPISFVDEDTGGSSTWNPEPFELRQVILYAEKANNKGVFQFVSDLSNDHKSLFKLTVLGQDENKAEFEVLESDYMMKLATNFPDTYLLTACTTENRNEDFIARILTVKKGIAHKVDGQWKVLSNEDKAKVKFL